MSEESLSNFRVKSQSLGTLFVQPTSSAEKDMNSASQVLFISRISKEETVAAVDWAASTQGLIFCVASDVGLFESHGFGAYRFHKLDGYRDVDFQGGTIEFHPARAPRASGLMGFAQELRDLLGWAKVDAYHVLVRPKGERPLLILSSTQVDPDQWVHFVKAEPSLIVAARSLTRTDALSLSALLKKKVLSAHDLSEVSTVASSSLAKAPNKAQDNGAWTQDINP